MLKKIITYLPADKKNVILYGAGRRASEVYFQIKDNNNVLCFVDKNENKQGTVMKMTDGKEYPVYSLADAWQKYGKSYMCITPDVPAKYEIIVELEKYGINKDFILNYEPYSYGMNCFYMEDILVIKSGRVMSCCEGGVENPLYRQYDNKISDEDFLQLVKDFKNDIRKDSPEYCKQCYYYKEAYYSRNLKPIKYIFFPSASLCQFNCIYCRRTEMITQTDIERALRFINYLKGTGFIDENTIFEIASYEITVNPLQNQVYNAVRNHRCHFLTNAEYFSEEIAGFLKAGRSKVNISVDSGTAKTFAKVKGRDCFAKVAENIRKYGECGNVELKYIILPGLNDNSEDAEGFVNLASEVKANVQISYDIYDIAKIDLNIESCVNTIKKIVAGAKSRGLKVQNNTMRETSDHWQRIADLFA